MAESKEKEPLWVDSGDKYHTPKPTRIFLAWCGCTSIKQRVLTILDYAGLQDIDKEKISLSRSLQRYIELNHLTEIVPALRRGTYSVLINPHTGAFLDLRDPSVSIDELKKKAYLMGKDKL